MRFIKTRPLAWTLKETLGSTVDGSERAVAAKTPRVARRLSSVPHKGQGNGKEIGGLTVLLQAVVGWRKCGYGPSVAMAC